MSRLPFLYQRSLFALLAFTAGAAAAERWPIAAFAGDPWRVLTNDSPEQENETWTDLFASAQNEIWLSVGRLESATLLDALERAFARGVAVHLTLSPSQNPDPNRGTRAWLRLKTGIRDTRIGPEPFSGARCVVDGAVCLISPEDLLAINAASSAGGLCLYANQVAAGARLRARLQAAHSAASRESPP